MHIQTYQIHNVLNVYRRQLSKGKWDSPQHMDTNKPSADQVTISEEGKHQSIMDKVAANVLKKITNVEPQPNFSQEMIRSLQNRETDLNKVQKEKEFVFNTIVGNNEKETRSIAVDNSQVLMNRLDQLAKAAVNRKTE